MPGLSFDDSIHSFDGCPVSTSSLLSHAMPLDSEGLVSKATIENVKRLGNALQDGSGFSGI